MSFGKNSSVKGGFRINTVISSLDARIAAIAEEKRITSIVTDHLSEAFRSLSFYLSCDPSEVEKKKVAFLNLELDLFAVCETSTKNGSGVHSLFINEISYVTLKDRKDASFLDPNDFTRLLKKIHSSDAYNTVTETDLALFTHGSNEERRLEHLASILANHLPQGSKFVGVTTKLVRELLQKRKEEKNKL